MNREMEGYRLVIEARKIIKKVSQVSWNSDKFDKRFPLELLDKGDEAEYIKTMLGFFGDIIPLANEINTFIEKEKETLKSLGISEKEINMNLFKKKYEDKNTPY